MDMLYQRRLCRQVGGRIEGGSTMLGKSKRVIEIMTFAVTGLALLLPGIGATAAGACVSVNWSTAESVNRLDALVHQYAADHNGLYPTYDELATMAEQRDKKYMTPQINIAARSFSFRPSQADAQKVGYAVSADRRDYVLLGVGGRRREVRLYGKIIQPLSTKVHIIHPSDNSSRHPDNVD
jgi:hypothetical protein